MFWSMKRWPHGIDQHYDPPLTSPAHSLTSICDSVYLSGKEVPNDSISLYITDTQNFSQKSTGPISK